MSNSVLPTPLNRLDEKYQIRRTLKSGETLFIQNDATSGLYYLLSGIIDLKRTTSQGNGVLIHRARERDTFAEASLFSDTYHCTATALCESVVMECQRNAISHLLNTDIEFARTMAARFAVQLQNSRRHIELLSIRSAEARILAALNDNLLTDDITTFADLIGIAPATAYRTLAQLSQDGRIVKTARGQYKIRT